MLNSIRNFSKTIFAKILLVIVVIPFVFWGMGGVFSSGNTNSLAKFDNINNNLISASAQGNVKIETKAETITSNSAKYNNKTNLISLEGNVIIKRDKSILTGEKGYMNLNTRKSKIESSKSKRVKGVFSPIKKYIRREN